MLLVTEASLVQMACLGQRGLKGSVVQLVRLVLRELPGILVVLVSLAFLVQGV